MLLVGRLVVSLDRWETQRETAPGGGSARNSAFTHHIDLLVRPGTRTLQYQTEARSAAAVVGVMSEDGIRHVGLGLNCMHRTVHAGRTA